MSVFDKPASKKTSPSKSKGSYDAFGGKLPEISDTLSGINSALDKAKEERQKKKKKKTEEPRNYCGCF